MPSTSLYKQEFERILFEPLCVDAMSAGDLPDAGYNASTCPVNVSASRLGHRRFRPVQARLPRSCHRPRRLYGCSYTCLQGTARVAVCVEPCIHNHEHASAPTKTGCQLEQPDTAWAKPYINTNSRLAWDTNVHLNAESCSVCLSVRRPHQRRRR